VQSYPSQTGRILSDGSARGVVTFLSLFLSGFALFLLLLMALCAWRGSVVGCLWVLARPFLSESVVLCRALCFRFGARSFRSGGWMGCVGSFLGFFLLCSVPCFPSPVHFAKRAALDGYLAIDGRGEEADPVRSGSGSEAVGRAGEAARA